MLAPWLTTGTYGNAQSPYSWTTLPPSSGAPRPPLLPRDLQLTCRTASLHQRRHRYLLQHAYIPGPANVLADIASRRFDLSDDALLRLLTTLSPHAQNWRMLTTSPELVSQLTCNLLRTRPDRPYLRNTPAPSIFSGPTTGCHTRNRWVWTLLIHCGGQNPLPPSPRALHQIGGRQPQWSAGPGSTRT